MNPFIIVMGDNDGPCRDCGHVETPEHAPCSCQCHDFERAPATRPPSPTAFWAESCPGSGDYIRRWPWLLVTWLFESGRNFVPPCPDPFCGQAHGRFMVDWQPCPFAQKALPPLVPCKPNWQLCPDGCGLTHRTNRPPIHDREWLQREWDGYRATFRRMARRDKESISPIIMGLFGYAVGRFLGKDKKT